MHRPIFAPTFAALAVLFFVSAAPAFAQHKLATQGNGKLVVVGKDGKVEWETPWEGVHDLHVLPNGNFLVPQGANKVVEIDRDTRKVIWTYDSGTANGNAGKRVEVHAIQPLGEGRVMIAESGPGRIIEVDRDGKLLHEVKLKIDHPNPHTDTRLARKLKSGNYLVCHEGDGVVREYDPKGEVVWEYAVPLFDKQPKDGHGPEGFGNKCFAAVRLPTGNTLISTGNGHSVLNVTPKKEIIWKLEQNDLPGVTLAWVTTLELLPNGYLVIGNCHAGPGQPLLVEIDPKSKKIAWKFDQFDAYGNSVSNSQILDQPGSLR